MIKVGTYVKLKGETNYYDNNTFCHVKLSEDDCGVVKGVLKDDPRVYLVEFYYGIGNSFIIPLNGPSCLLKQIEPID